MKKYLLILILALIGFSCSQENELEGNNSVQNGFQVNTEFIDLSVSGSNQQAGLIKVNSDEDEVKIKWISHPSFNIDTTQTSITMKNGQGTLPIKWQRKQENGTYTPENILFKAGVVITSGTEQKYIPLYNVQNLDSAKVIENIRTRADIVTDPRISSIEFIPNPPVMGENGSTLLVKLINIQQAVVDYSNIKTGHNIDADEANLPTLLSDAQSVLRFKWKDANVRPAAFAIPIFFYAFELVNPVGFTLVWNPEQPTIIVNPERHEVAHTGGVVSSQITSNTSWIATTALEDWFTMAPASGTGNGTITFTVAPNATAATRTATVAITAGSVTRNITISQAAGDVSLTVSPLTHNIAQNGGTVSSTVTCNTTWTVSKGTETWLLLDRTGGSGNGTISFTVSPNTGAARSATVTVKAGSVTKQVVITQAPNTIEGKPGDVTIEDWNGQTNQDVNADL